MGHRYEAAGMAWGPGEGANTAAEVCLCLPAQMDSTLCIFLGLGPALCPQWCHSHRQLQCSSPTQTPSRFILYFGSFFLEAPKSV